MTTRIYYTGDRANREGWFTTEEPLAHSSELLTLTEEPTPWGDQRTFKVNGYQIGRLYEGHGSPRFVTEAAYNAYHFPARTPRASR